MWIDIRQSRLAVCSRYFVDLTLVDDITIINNETNSVNVIQLKLEHIKLCPFKCVEMKKKGKNVIVISISLPDQEGHPIGDQLSGWHLLFWVQT